MHKKYKFLLIVLISFHASFGNIYSIDEEMGYLNGLMKTVGIDRGRDTYDNPALMNLADKKYKYTLSLANTLKYYLALKNPLYGDNTLSNFALDELSLSFSAMHLLKNKFSIGIYFDNHFSDEIENMDYYEKFQAIIPAGMSSTDKGYSGEFLALGINAGIGLNFKLTEKDWLGVSLRFSYLDFYFSRKFTINFSGAPSNTGTTVQGELLTAARIKTGLLISYVNHSDIGDLSFAVIPFTYVINDDTKELTFNYTLNGTLLQSISLEENYQNEWIEPVIIKAGISQAFGKNFKLFLEGSVKIPMKIEYRSDELQFVDTLNPPKLITFDVTKKYEFSPEIGVGAFIKIPNVFNIHTGFRMVENLFELDYTSSINESDNITRSTSTTTYIFQLGFSKVILQKIQIYLSTTYKSQVSDITESRYIGNKIEQSTYEGKVQRLDIITGADYKF